MIGYLRTLITKNSATCRSVCLNMVKLNDREIKNYINEIKQSIINDCGTALEAYWEKFSKDKISAGFFAIPRLLFPEVDGLGSYITGQPMCTGLNIKTYLEKVMSQIDPCYLPFSSFIAFIYRNGLLHQHQPKRFRYKGKELGWWFSIVSPNNPLDIERKYHLIIINDTLMFDMKVFYTDVVDSIDLALDMILNNTKNEFQKTYNIQNRPLTKHSLLNYKKKGKWVRKIGDCKYIGEKDFKFLSQFK